MMLDTRSGPLVDRIAPRYVIPFTRYPLLTMLLLSLLLPGCARKFTRANYDSIYVGQEQWEVAETLGDPKSQGRFAREWHYVKDSSKHYYKAIIAFDEDRRVASKRWVEPGREGPEGVQGTGFRKRKSEERGARSEGRGARGE